MKILKLNLLLWMTVPAINSVCMFTAINYAKKITHLDSKMVVRFYPITLDMFQNVLKTTNQHPKKIRYISFGAKRNH